VGSRRTAIVAVAATVVVAAAGITVFVLTRGTESAQPQPDNIVAPSEIPPATTTAVAPVTRIPTSPAPLEITETDLRRQTSNDAAAAERLVGQWVPQLSSKNLGLVVGGVTYDYPAIMADFRTLHDRFPEAVMVNSSDYNNFSRKDFWVTLEASVFSTAEAANAWCDEQGFAAQDCHAGRLTHTGGPAGNSKPRGR
jgi:serine/threonine-protein kinase